MSGSKACWQPLEVHAALKAAPSFFGLFAKPACLTEHIHCFIHWTKLSHSFLKCLCVSEYTWTYRAMIVSLPLSTWRKFKQSLDRHNNLASALTCSTSDVHINFVWVLRKEKRKERKGKKKISIWLWTWTGHEVWLLVSGPSQKLRLYLRLKITPTPILPWAKFPQWWLWKKMPGHSANEHGLVFLVFSLLRICVGLILLASWKEYLTDRTKP